MRIRSFVVAVVLATVVFTCGRTEVVTYDFPIPTVDAGRDAGVLDAGLVPFDAGTKPCIEGRFPLAPATPVVVLVLDKSGSMAERFGGPTTDTKWNALRDSLRTTLPAVNETMQLGLLLYPVSINQSCSSFVRPNLDPALRQVPTIIQALDDALPAGGTPTADAIQAAANSLLDRRTASTARALVLATDGVPNCNSVLNPRTCVCSATPPCSALACVDDDRSVLRVSNIADAGIPTYVIGIESNTGSSFDSLDRMAVAGGRALPAAPGGRRYYAATNSAELAQAFSSIRDQVARCTFLTSSVPNATGSIRVEADERVVPFDPSGVMGWSWSDRPNGEVVFRGAACNQVMMGVQKLEAVVACGQ